MGYVNTANPSEAEIKEELTTIFPDQFTGDSDTSNKEKFLEHCIKIARFLSDTSAVKTGLMALEKKLDAKVNQRLFTATAHYKAMAEGEKSTLEDDLRHLLSNELSQMEIQWGFNLFQCPGYENSKVQTYVGFVQPEEFRAQVQKGRHWKDPGVPDNHGEYTHRLQWYLLAESLKEILTERPVKLFASIGGVINKDKPNSGLWDALFDRDVPGAKNVPFKIASSITDCRSPESFTNFVISNDNDKDMPFLHWFIKARLKKRQTQPLNQYYFAKAYVEKKLKKYGLTDQQATKIVGTWREFGKPNGPVPILQPGAPVVRE